MGNAAILHVDWRLQRLVVSAHLALDATRFLPMGILTFPGRQEAHYGVLLADISSLPSILSVPVGLYSCIRTLLDSYPDLSFFPALLAG